MSSSFNLPPFPLNLPIVPLKMISYAKLAASDAEEEVKLLEASTELGFFYLDLRNAGTREQTLLDDANTLFDLAPQFFAVPNEEKAKYDLTKNDGHGYKSMGQSMMDKKGTPDEMEFLNISNDVLLSKSAGNLLGPSIINAHYDLLRRYIESAHGVQTTILKALTSQLHLPPITSLLNYHRITRPSSSQMRLTYAPPSTGTTQTTERQKLGEHTDFGSLSLLFNRLGGLQVLPPNTNTWHYVRPVPGHAIVNLGDAMVHFTNGLLRSNLHRVVSPPGDQAGLTRVSLVYFMRPEDEAVLKRLEGSDLIPELVAGQTQEDVTAKDWIHRRVVMRMKGFFSPEKWEETIGTEAGRGVVAA